MTRRIFPWYALALTSVILGAAALGVPVTALLVPLLVLACPLMMMLMHGGSDKNGSCGHGVGDNAEHQDSADRR